MTHAEHTNHTYTHTLSFANGNHDLLVAAVFGKKSQGIYIDLGADHPVRNSVTHQLHALGWTGYNQLAARTLASAFAIERPDDKTVVAQRPDPAAIAEWAASQGAKNIFVRIDGNEIACTSKEITVVLALKPALVLGLNLSAAQKKVFTDYHTSLTDHQGATYFAQSKAIQERVEAAAKKVAQFGAVPQCVVAEIAMRDLEIADLKDKIEDAKKSQKYVDELIKEVQRRKRLRHQLVVLVRSIDKAVESVLSGPAKQPTAEPDSGEGELLSDEALYARIRGAYEERASFTPSRSPVRRGLAAGYHAAKKPIKLAARGARKAFKRR